MSIQRPADDSFAHCSDPGRVIEALKSVQDDSITYLLNELFSIQARDRETANTRLSQKDVEIKQLRAEVKFIKNEHQSLLAKINRHRERAKTELENQICEVEQKCLEIQAARDHLNILKLVLNKMKTDSCVRHINRLEKKLLPKTGSDEDWDSTSSSGSSDSYDYSSSFNYSPSPPRKRKRI